MKLKPFHGWRIQANTLDAIPDLSEASPIPEKSIYHQEALPALYLYQVVDEFLVIIYSALIGMNYEVCTASEYVCRPIVYRPAESMTELLNRLTPWSQYPEIIIKDTIGLTHQISVIQSFSDIQEIIESLQLIEFECLFPNQENNSPLVSLVLFCETQIPVSFPIGILIAPSPHVENPSPYSAGF